MSGSQSFVELCEGRRLLSASPIEIASVSTSPAGPAVHSNLSHALHGVQPIALQLRGSVSGDYTLKQSNPDTGEAFHFQGRGNLTPAGSLRFVANVMSSGNIADGQSSGAAQLRIAGAGTLTLRLVGPSQFGVTPVPDVFNFTISAGTGKYSKASGAGYIALSRTPSPTQGSSLVSHGKFSMSFLTIPPP